MITNFLIEILATHFVFNLALSPVSIMTVYVLHVQFNMLNWLSQYEDFKYCEWFCIATAVAVLLSS